MSEDSTGHRLEFFVAGAERVFLENDNTLAFSHWSYKVLTRSFLESYQNPPILPCSEVQNNFIKGDGYIDYCTWHRYSDFQWLAAEVSKELPGIIFPPIPEKDINGTIDKLTAHFVGSDGLDASTNELVSQRSRRLQMTLNALAQTDIAHESQAVMAFTTLEEVEWHKFRESRECADKPSFFSSIRESCSDFLERLGVSGGARDAGHSISARLDSIMERHEKMVDIIKKCSDAVDRMSKSCLMDLPKRKKLANISKPLQKCDLPATACCIGSVVECSSPRGRIGVVKDMDGEKALVDWVGHEGKVS
ncbi:unnamed protein product, partial [Trypanosoma congolense IL3000]